MKIVVSVKSVEWNEISFNHDSGISLQRVNVIVGHLDIVTGLERRHANSINDR